MKIILPIGATKSPILEEKFGKGSFSFVREFVTEKQDIIIIIIIIRND